MHKILFALTVLLLPVLFSGCAVEEADPEETEPVLQVVTTIYPLADIAGQLGGDQVEVFYLLPAGASPHTYEPTVEQARMVARADLFVYVGADLDTWALNMTEAAGPEIVTLNLSKQVNLIRSAGYYDLDSTDLEEESHDHQERDDCDHDDCDHDHDHDDCDHDDCDHDHDHDDCAHDDCDHDHGPEDPHFWLDPLAVRDSICPAIHKELVKLAPGSEVYFDRRLELYQQQLTALHEEIAAAAAGFSRDSFIAFHSAWQYFADRYDLEELAVIARFPGQEPSAGWVAGLVELIRKEDIGAIFTEPQFSAELAERIAEESGTEVKVIDPLGGAGITGRETYLDLMRFNLSVFRAAME